MLKLRDKRNNKEVASDPVSIEKLLNTARQNENKPDLVYHRRRIIYGLYVVEVWSEHPADRPAQAKHLYDIEGATRKNLNAHPTPIKGKPSARPDHGNSNRP